MLRKNGLSILFLVACLSSVLATAVAQTAAPVVPTINQIIENNITARGGLKAWREIKTMAFAGKMDAGSKFNVQLPFEMKLQRPQMSRLELKVAGKSALQVYDGTNGWKVRPFLGRMEVEPFTRAELESINEQQDIDGYLIDHEVKGIKVELVGTEPIEGHDAYKLKLTMKNGDVRHLWVDAKSFLEVKIEGNPRKLDGKMHKVEVYYRDYKRISGLMIPFIHETVVEKVKDTHKINIETIALNPRFEENVFAKPLVPNTATRLRRNVSSVQIKAGDAR